MIAPRQKADSTSVCPECHGRGSKVLVTRNIDGRHYRRRRCFECGLRWTTWEVSQDEWREFTQWRDGQSRVAKAKALLSRERRRAERES